MNRFIIFTRGRTGSSALADDLNKHPQIVCHQELFEASDGTSNDEDSLGREMYYSNWQKRVQNPSLVSFWSYLDDIARDKGALIQGFKILLPQFEKRKGEGIEKILWNTDIKIIYLIRDPVCEAISLVLANERKLFNVNVKDKQQIEYLNTLKPVCLSPGTIDAQVVKIINTFRNVISFLNTVTNPVYVAAYEGYFGEDREKAHREILEFLEVPLAPAPQSNNLIKVTSAGWKKDIENIDEILEYLASHNRDLTVARQRYSQEA